ENHAAEPESPESPALPAEPTASQPASPPRISLGQSRRLGLGAPLRQVRAMSIQRAAGVDAPSASDSARNDVPSPASVTPPAEPATTPLPADPVSAQSVDPEQLTVSRLATDLDSAQVASAARLALPLAPSGPNREQAPVDETTQSSEPGDFMGSLSSSAQPDITPMASMQRLVGSDHADTVTHGRERELPLLQRQASSSRDLAAELEEPPGPTAASSVSMDGAAISAHRPSASAQPASFAAELPAAALRGTTPAPLALRPSLQRAQLAPLVGSRPLSAMMPIQRTAAAPAPAQPAALPRPADATGIPSAFAMLDRDRPDTLPVQTLAVTRSHDVSPQPASTEWANPGRQLLQPMPHVLSRPGSVASRSVPTPLPLAPLATMASVQRSAAETASAAPTADFVSMQRADLDPGHNSPVAREWPSVQAAGGAASTPAAPDAQGRSDENIDALAGQLYERIRVRLKSELLVDRERAGLLTDLR
ncbi:MAG TPA: hypothetical protein VIN00_04885, partial [Candidatus Dormibacteraeota bacterium]